MIGVSFFAVVVPLLLLGRVFRELWSEVHLTDHGDDFEERWEFPLLGREEGDR